MRQVYPPATILVVDDDPGYRERHKDLLHKNGYKVLVAATVEEAREHHARQSLDLVLLEILPDKGGWEFCKDLVDTTSVPVVIVSYSRREENIVRGLKLGAVDYIGKDVSHSELLARIKATLRWYRPAPENATQTYYDDGYLSIDLNLKSERVCVSGKPIKLTATEYKLLTYLFAHAGHICTHLELLQSVWGPAYQEPVHYIHNYIRYLRQALEPDPRHPQYLISVRGRGYSFRKRSEPHLASLTHRAEVEVDQKTPNTS